jgi:hypothetical protein
MMCRDVVAATTDAEEGALKGWRRLSYRFHLGICPFCRAHAAQVETTVSTLRALPKDAPSDDSRERAIAAFRNRKRDV